jgi:hypothetical protein
MQSLDGGRPNLSKFATCSLMMASRTSLIGLNLRIGLVPQAHG